MQIGLILLALAFPLLELAVLIKVGQTIGFWWTVLLLVAMGVGGGLLVQQQGISAARRAMETLSQGRPPIEPVVDSLMLMLAGMLLLIPGLLTDIAGLALLIPPLRHAAARWMLSRMISGADIRVETHEWRSPGRGAPEPGPDGHRRAPGGGTVIDGEWKQVDEPNPPPRGVDSDKPRPK